MTDALVFQFYVLLKFSGLEFEIWPWVHPNVQLTSLCPSIQSLSGAPPLFLILVIILFGVSSVHGLLTYATLNGQDDEADNLFVLDFNLIYVYVIQFPGF